ncbi:hypothetical protein [Scytonema sp. HK-05]|uniref:hypothetical protein n=1 Tax=Scytonema sp. HK-05 TaxID=1137095 RepID=UPI00093675A6|nr:hypothetical protein [Scytonema sp. HK-05]OKH57421.1 hypothetical protein NIES2130_20070 [Scytonema sp. HK-05]
MTSFSYLALKAIALRAVRSLAMVRSTRLSAIAPGASAVSPKGGLCQARKLLAPRGTRSVWATPEGDHTPHATSSY